MALAVLIFSEGFALDKLNLIKLSFCVQANQSKPLSQLQLRKAEINGRSTHWMCVMKQKVILTKILLF